MPKVVETRNGPMMAEPLDEYVGRSLIELGEFGEDQVKLFGEIVTDEMIVVEVGANIGALTVPLARMAKIVHAFEPQRHVYHMLCGNVALNSLMNVHCYHAAIGEREEVIGIPTLRTDVVNNLGAFNLGLQGQIKDRVQVAPLTIPCHFLKIDVEGYEREVLLGAEPMIRECQPVIYIENDRRAKADALILQLQGLGYKCYWHVTPMFRQENYRGVKADIFGGMCSFDMICVTGEIADGVEAKVGDLEEMLREGEALHAA